MQKLLYIAFFLFCACYLQAQNPYFRHITKTSGLPSNEVYDIFQDTKGYIWLTCGKGLVRYDGFEYKIYTHPKQSSKPGSLIKEDIYGRIWYMNFDNLLYYVENDSLIPFLQDKNANLNIYALIENYLLLPIKDKIEIWDIQTFTKIKEVIMPQQIAFFQGARQIREYLYFFHHKTGLYKIDKNGNLTFIHHIPEIDGANYSISIQSIQNQLIIT